MTNTKSHQQVMERNMDESRKQFEEWIANTTNSDLHRGIMLDRRESGAYSHLSTENKWEAWQASRASIEIELPPVCDAHSGDIDKGYDICHYRTQECLKKQGIRFKIEGAERWSQPSAPLESK